MYDWFAQLAGPGDVIDDPSVAWPEERRLLKLGTIDIVRLTFDQELASRTTSFSPGNLPPGIEPADPMIAARDAAYRVSYRDRQ
jgi:catalase